MKRVLVGIMISLLMVSLALAQTKEKQLKGTKD